MILNLVETMNLLKRNKFWRWCWCWSCFPDGCNCSFFSIHSIQSSLIVEFCLFWKSKGTQTVVLPNVLDGRWCLAWKISKPFPAIKNVTHFLWIFLQKLWFITRLQLLSVEREKCWGIWFVAKNFHSKIATL